MTKLFELTRGMNLRRLVEVGVGSLSQLKPFYDSGEYDKITMVEVRPDIVDQAKQYYTSDKVEIINKGVADKNGELEFYIDGDTTHMAELPSTPVHFHGRKYSKEPVKLPVVKFTEIEPFMIDLLAVDIEGGEWFVIKHMKNRPKIISLETHSSVNEYRNPYIKQIKEWLEVNGYYILYVGASDTIYIKK
jgi:FkbM family methyltransferase